MYVALGQYMSKVKSPAHTSLGQKDNIKLRIYLKIILAEIEIQEGIKDAIKNSFGKLYF